MSEIAMEENRKVGIRKMFSIRGARDKPRDSYGSTAYSFLFGLEQVFPFLGVRVVSVNDGYDSAMLDGQTGC